MASHNMHFKIISSVIMKTITITALLFQLHGMLLIYSIENKRKQEAIFHQCLRNRKVVIQRLRSERKRRRSNKKRSCWYQIGRTDLWWQNLSNGVSPSEWWKKNFRLNKLAFKELVEILRPYITPNPISPNRRAIPADKKVAITLYYLKDTGSLNMTANTFGIAICTTSAILMQVCNAIVKHIGPNYLKFPKDSDEIQKKVSEFETKFGMMQAFGCIDGTHIPIICPDSNSHDYYCYKQFHSLNVQAVCDYRGVFMDVECMWPGSVHDAKVFANSLVNKKLCSSKLPKTYQTIGRNNIKVPNYLIGDPAYPLVPHCMREFSTCKTNQEVIFNAMLRSARNPIECAFGRLKARWQILTRKMDLKLENIPTVIHACFILHNFCEKNDVYIDEDQVQTQIELIKTNETTFRNIPDPIYSCNNDEGEIIRHALTEYIHGHIL